jgi:Protein of unknown function (DUF1573)
MKKHQILLLTISVLTSFMSCKKIDGVDPNTGLPKVLQTSESFNEAPKSNLPKTTMTFEKDVHDFGTIDDQSKVAYTFSFTNTGQNDLEIVNAAGSCGCTVPEYPKDKIKPGESGKILVSFSPTGKSGKQEKSVTLTANVPNDAQIIRIKANINPKSK